MKFKAIIVSQFLILRTSDVMIHYYSVLEIFRINSSTTSRKNSGVSSSVLESKLLLVWAMIFSLLLMPIVHNRA